MNEQQKRIALANLHLTPEDKILELIQEGHFTFEELQRSGKFSHEKQKYVRESLDSIREDKEIESNFWEDCQERNDISAYNEYINAYPSGRYTSIAKAKITEIESRIAEEREDIYRSIADNSGEYTGDIIRQYLDERRILKKDLIERDIITEKGLRLFLNPPRYALNTYQWEDLPDLPKGNTDVYFFGIPSSGKSCVLAGLFFEANKKGLLSPHTSNHEGVKYLNELKRCVQDGYVPPSTPTDCVNFISLSLHYENQEHSLSLIEMSGEYFRQTYENASTSEGTTIGANGYLHNDNRKSIFMVVDYFADAGGRLDTVMGDTYADQQDLLIYCLRKLEEDGTLNKTDTIQVIVTKSDMMDDIGENKENLNQRTQEFIERNYNSLLNEMMRLNKKYDINSNQKNGAIIIPFSLGRFMLEKVFEYDDYSSTELLKSIINSTASKRQSRKGTFGALFR